MERRTALCRGCEATLTETEAGYWMDGDGIVACIKALAGREPVMHMPLPEGMRGAPR